MKAVLICMSLVLAFVTAPNPDCYRAAAYGACHGYHTKWAYSQVQKKCFRFDYSGCGGNYNRFSSESACLRYCYERRVPAPTKTTMTTMSPNFDYYNA